MIRAKRLHAAAAGAAAVAVALLGGCVSEPPGPVSYTCADGTAFSLSVDRDAEHARIAFGGMEFGLRREPAASGVRYGCDVLSVWLTEAAAQIDVQGSVRQCRAAR